MKFSTAIEGILRGECWGRSSQGGYYHIASLKWGNDSDPTPRIGFYCYECGFSEDSTLETSAILANDWQKMVNMRVLPIILNLRDRPISEPNRDEFKENLQAQKSITEAIPILVCHPDNFSPAIEHLKNDLKHLQYVEDMIDRVEHHMYHVDML